MSHNWLVGGARFPHMPSYLCALYLQVPLPEKCFPSLCSKQTQLSIYLAPTTYQTLCLTFKTLLRWRLL